MVRKFDGSEFKFEGEPDHESAPIIRITNTIIQEALRSEAKEILVEREESGLIVRYYIDDKWKDVMQLPLHIQRSVTQRLRLMADLNPSLPSPTVPEQGDFSIQQGDRFYSIALRTEPVEDWERISMVVQAK